MNNQKHWEDKMYTLDNENNDYRMMEIDGKVLYYFCDKNGNFYFVFDDIIDRLMSYLKLNKRNLITLNILNELESNNINTVFGIGKGCIDIFITLEGVIKILKLYPENSLIQFILNLQSKIMFPYYIRLKDSSEIDLYNKQKKEGKNWDE